jgi:hypothetical protein
VSFREGQSNSDAFRALAKTVGGLDRASLFDGSENIQKLRLLNVANVDLAKPQKPKTSRRALPAKRYIHR